MRTKRVYVRVSGGAVQGVSGPPGMDFILLDEDIYKEANDEGRAEFEANEKRLAEDTAAGLVSPTAV